MPNYLPKPSQYKHHFLALLLTASLGVCGLAHAEKLTKPEKVGVSKQRLEQLDRLTQGYVDNGQYSGIVTMVARNGKVIHSSAKGQYGVDNDKPMTQDTLFRIYSMTKPITALAAMILFEQGKFRMNDPVSKFLPELANLKVLDGEQLREPKEPMQMRHLFTHTAGFTYGFTPDNPVDTQYNDSKLLQSKSLAEFMTRLATMPLRFDPGTRFHYSVSTDVLGAVIEKISGQTLDVFFSEQVFEPLGMQDTFFQVPESKMHRLASDQTWDIENSKIKAIPASQQRSFSEVGFYSGGGGLVSTIGDYMKFCQMVLNGGSLNGAYVVSPKTIEFYSSNHLSKKEWANGRGQYPFLDLYPGQSMALGQGVVFNPALMPSLSSKGGLSWGGIAGTKYWIDPKEKLIGIAMVQLYQAPWRPGLDMQAVTYRALEELYN